ncbi:DUF1622 domain-containing protein [Zongyangia hominis]|uniref:DUF1622 domain-containing protein n=1 Tax=Zongyangia hominis TaxID=2763677 RepID=A0A926E8M8_9FIRM|nr:DUF1622 domain-containing protein [Zongyangia hominis]MBC8569915.1 DUF1622 domain-containing protein [Zongyangia hominis]
MEMMHSLLNNIVDVAIVFFEFMGVIVIIVSGIRGIISYVRRDPLTRLNLAKGMAMGLEFKLGSEILRTVVVRQFSEILTVAGIIALRAALTFLIHWEIRNEEADNHLETIDRKSWKGRHDSGEDEEKAEK